MFPYTEGVRDSDSVSGRVLLVSDCINNLGQFMGNVIIFQIALGIRVGGKRKLKLIKVHLQSSKKHASLTNLQIIQVHFQQFTGNCP